VHDYVFPTGTTIPANSRLVIAEDMQLFKNIYPETSCYGPLGFGLDNKQETISLLDIQHTPVQTFTYHDSIPWLQTADGLGRTLELRAGATNLNDPANWFTGCMGGSPGQAYQVCNDEIVFSEINYNSSLTSDAGDWVELHNPGSGVVAVSGWKFSDSENLHLFTIPANTSVKAGEYLVLYGEKLKFESLFPSVENTCGPFNFGLSGSGEAIRLFDNTGKLRFSVVYDDDLPWPKDADGSGYTLEMNDARGNVNDGLNWFAGCKGGSPGKAYLFPCNLGIDETSAASFTVYPNPAKTELFILRKANDHADRADIRMRDALGQIVLVKQISFSATSLARLSLGEINNGIYFMEISMGNQQTPLLVKVVVAR